MDTTKTKLRQRISVPDEVVQFLRWHIDTQLTTPEQEASELLFSARDGGYLNEHCLRQPFARRTRLVIPTSAHLRDAARTRALPPPTVGRELGFDWTHWFDDAARATMTGHPSDAAALRDHADHPRAAPTPDHFIPLLHIAGLASASREVAQVLIDGYALGCLSMTSFTLDAKRQTDGGDRRPGASLPDARDVPAEGHERLTSPLRVAHPGEVKTISRRVLGQGDARKDTPALGRAYVPMHVSVTSTPRMGTTVVAISCP